jgi:hypothetical protein
MFRGFAIGEGDELASLPPHGMVNGRWVHGSYIYTKDSSGAEVHCIWGLDHGPDGKLVEKITLGRCTGVFDFEDEIVYEGDILKCEDEQAIMRVEWLETGAYFMLHYMYKDGIENWLQNYCVPFDHFLKAGKRFTVIGNKITPMKQLCVHFPDYKRESTKASKQKLSARDMEIIRGRETLKSLDEETQKQLKAYVKQTLRPQAGVKNTPVVKSLSPSPVVVKPLEPRQPKSHLVLIECSTYMASVLPLIREHLKKRVKEIMQMNSDLSIVWFSGEDECDMFVERFEISDKSDYAYLSKRLDQCLKPAGQTALTNPLTLITALACRQDITPSVLIITSGNVSPRDEMYVHKVIKNLTHCAEKITLVGYGTGCNRKLLGEMASQMMAEQMKAALVYCETFDSYVPEIEKFLSDGRIPVAAEGGQTSSGIADTAKKPVAAVPVKPVASPADAIRVEIPLEEFVSACKLLMRKALGKKKNMVIFSARDSQFLLEWGNVGSILPAKGVWPETVSIRGNNFLGITEVPPRQDPVVLEIKGEQFCVDGFICACLVKGTPKRISSQI